MRDIDSFMTDLNQKCQRGFKLISRTEPPLHTHISNRPDGSQYGRHFLFMEDNTLMCVGKLISNWITLCILFCFSIKALTTAAIC